MASDDMLSWLKATIEGDKAAAEKAASGEHDGVALTGCWTHTDGYRAVFQEGCASGADGIVGGSCGCCFPDATGRPEDLAHIALHDPRDTIARCEAELEILDQVLPEVRRIAVRLAEEFGGICPDDWLSPSEKMLLKTLARGYRNRAGWNPDWVSD